MNKKGLCAALAMLSALLAGCADERVAGKGAASETTNGIVLEGRLTKSDGSPAARVAVRLGRPETDSVYSTTLTDDSGAYSLRAPRPGRYQVRGGADSTGSVSWVSVGTASRQRVDPAVSTRLSSMRGSLTGEFGDPATLRVRIPALGAQAQVGQDLSWKVADVPEGWHLVQVVRVGGDVEGELTGSTYVSNSIPVSKRVFALVDDFEADQGQGRMVHLLDGSWWGRWNDTSSLIDSSRTWAGTPGLATDSSAWSGRSLRVPMRVGAAFAQRPDLVRSAGVVIKIGGREDLDSQSVWFDLTKIDSVVFCAKGAGTVEFQVKARSRAEQTRTGFFRKTVILSGNWTRHAFAAADFVADAGLDWPACQVRELLWTTRESSVDLWLDDIELVGIRPSDLLKR